MRGRLLSPALRRRLLAAVLVALAVWVLLLDSHSVLRRVQLAQERRALHAEVEQLRERNEALRARIRAGVTDELVEEIAREQYGMRRPGETVYPVENGR